MATASVRFRKWVGSAADRLLGRRDLTARGRNDSAKGVAIWPRNKTSVGTKATRKEHGQRHHNVLSGTTPKVSVAERTQGNV